MEDIWQVIKAVEDLVRAVAKRCTTAPARVVVEQDSDDYLEPVSIKRTQTHVLSPPSSYYQLNARAGELPQVRDLQPFATVHGLAGGVMVGYANPNSKIVRLDTCVFREDKSFLGWVIDVFGRVQRPFYSIMVSEPCELGLPLYHCRGQPTLTKEQIMILKAERGTDASYKNDVEAHRKAIESSDDDEEVQKRRARREGDEWRRKKAREEVRVVHRQRKVGEGDGQLQEGEIQSGLQQLMSKLRESRLTKEELQQLKGMTVGQLLQLKK